MDLTLITGHVFQTATTISEATVKVNEFEGKY